MWQTVDYKENTVKWYEAELINDIREAVQRVLNANHCNNCDGIGLDECGDMECGVKAAQMIEEMIQENEGCMHQ